MKDVKDNKLILLIMTVINVAVLCNYTIKGEIKHGVGYFVFFYVAIFIIHYFTKKQPPLVNIEVRKPQNELLVAVLFAIFGFIFLTLNFMQKSHVIPKNMFITLPILFGIFLFSMPFGTLIYLLINKYKLINLGFKTKPYSYFLLAVIIYCLTGFFSVIFNLDGILWKEKYAEIGGIVGIIVQGIIGAALFEEFSRFIIQSRCENIIRISGINILIATTFWAFMHLPVTMYNGANLQSTIIYCIQIIPIGFIWGYLTQRTNSILPSTLIHGLNLWGFQN